MSLNEIFSLKKRKSLTPFRDKKMELNLLALSPDGAFLGVTHQEGEVAIFETRTHKRLYREQSPIEDSGVNWTIFMFRDWFSWGMCVGEHTGRPLPGRTLPEVSFLPKYKQMLGPGPGGDAMLRRENTNCPISLCGASKERPFVSFPREEYWSARGAWSEACRRGVFTEEHWLDGSDFLGAKISVVNAAGERLHQWQLDDGNIASAGEDYAAAIDPKGRWIAAGGSSFEGIKVWNLRTQELQRCQHQGNIFSLCASPEGRLVVGVTGQQAIIWEIGRADPVHVIPVKTGNCYSVAWREGALYLLTKTKILFWEYDPK